LLLRESDEQVEQRALDLEPFEREPLALDGLRARDACFAITAPPRAAARIARQIRRDRREPAAHRSVALRRLVECRDPRVLREVRGCVRVRDELARDPLQKARVREQFLRRGRSDARVQGLESVLQPRRTAQGRGSSGFCCSHRSWAAGDPLDSDKVRPRRVRDSRRARSGQVEVRVAMPAARDGRYRRSTHLAAPRGPDYARRVDWRERLTIVGGVRNGKPCIRGTRITVYDILEYLAGGMTEDQILADFPSIVREDIRAVLSFAAARERRLGSSPAA